jgi:glycosyltransferase involved in cell wall biosynthesis
MKIAQVAPLFESVPPKLYGGTERIVFHLTEELVRRDHNVTLYASGDSLTSARLISPCATGVRLDSYYTDPVAYHILMLGQLSRDAHLYDIIHFHTVFLHYPLLRRLSTPAVTTLHGRLDLPDLHPVHREFAELDVISISDSQRKPLPELNWQGTVYHGLSKNQFKFEPHTEDYLLFLGRISPEKRPDRAIEIAKRTGIRLKIAAKVDNADKSYFEQQIKPLLDHPLVEFLGEIDETRKRPLLSHARALLFPIDWPEPFGLVMIEALACGTPVIAFRCGSVPEIIEHGISGYIVDNMNQATEAVHRIGEIDRRTCRQRFETRFSVETMTDAYLNVYQKVITKTRSGNIYDVIGEQQIRKTKQDRGGTTGIVAG